METFFDESVLVPDSQSPEPKLSENSLNPANRRRLRWQLSCSASSDFHARGPDHSGCGETENHISQITCPSFFNKCSDYEFSRICRTFFFEKSDKTNLHVCEDFTETVGNSHLSRDRTDETASAAVSKVAMNLAQGENASPSELGDAPDRMATEVHFAANHYDILQLESNTNMPIIGSNEVERSHLNDLATSSSTNCNDVVHKLVNENLQSTQRNIPAHEFTAEGTKLSGCNLTTQKFVNENRNVPTDRDVYVLRDVTNFTVRKEFISQGINELLPTKDEIFFINKKCLEIKQKPKELVDAVDVDEACEDEEIRSSILLLRNLRLNQSSDDFKSIRSGSLDLSARLNLVLTAADSRKRSFIRRAVHRLNGFVFTRKVDHCTTHVVMGSAQRTLKLLLGMVLGCWILNSRWVFDSYRCGYWLDEHEYEATDYFKHVVTYRNFRSSGKKVTIFTNCGEIYIASVKTCSRNDLLTMLIMCGAVVTCEESSAKITIGCNPHGCLTNATHVNEKWIFDSITNFECMPLRDYIISHTK